MSLVRWYPMWDPFEEMGNLVGRLPATAGAEKLVGGFVPTMDIYETKEAVMVESQLAGVKPEEVKISVEKGVLTVQGEVNKEHEIDEKNYYRKEIRSGSFFRQVALPTAIKEDKIRAEFADGLLKITCPKAEPTKAAKIDIKIVKKNK
ncbi:MAG TPA: Hsp20/alpha crystallin family protein [Patescibacteria group bacterium]|nr:Hsp20/alpha crystallin family protein [Patescibacteria group bacterium]